MGRDLESLALQRNSLAEQAYVKLREAIVTGVLSPGERLVERQLGLLMGVSRTPLREAMIRLQHEGLLTLLPSGGVTVASINEREARELYAIRIGLEGYATRLAAQAADATAIAELRAIAKLEHRRLAPLDLRELEHLNNVFHRALYAASAMRRLAEVIEIYREQALHYRIYDIYRADEVRRGVAQHDELIDAVETRDGDLAERLMREHISLGAEIVLERRVERSEEHP
jgi:DNA-binding GntR family transcriptional regulator